MFLSIKKNKPGFTLIELLVVIAIIGLLSTLSIVALTQARARSRDARRIGDVRQIRTALEMYYNDVRAYPVSLTAGTQISSGSVIYMDIVPKPPLPGDGAICGSPSAYTYAVSHYQGVQNSSYSLNYCLGRDTAGIFASMNTATPAGIQSPPPRAQACVPDCLHKQCGDNGCDGQCGVCRSGLVCVNFECVAGGGGDIHP